MVHEVCGGLLDNRKKRWYLKQTNKTNKKKSMSEVSMCAECSCGTVLCVQRGEGIQGGRCGLTDEWWCFFLSQGNKFRFCFPVVSREASERERASVCACQRMSTKVSCQTPPAVWGVPQKRQCGSSVSGRNTPPPHTHPHTQTPIEQGELETQV